ncbi:DKNYY domain-containing protein [Candidatus Uhrbacteria bacterium]|nr:DKNYY domain-containing protein [Candidatus Uhrbacteria bacterium]
MPNSKNFKSLPIGMKILALWIGATPLFAVALVVLDENFQSPLGVGVGVVVSIISLLISWGLILRKNWVRILVIVGSFINIAFSGLNLVLLFFFIGLDAVILFLAFPAILGICLSSLIIWYLKKSSVRALFCEPTIHSAVSEELQHNEAKYIKDPRDKIIALFFLGIPIALFLIDGFFHFTRTIAYQIFTNQYILKWYYGASETLPLFSNIATLLFSSIIFASVIVGIIIAILFFSRKKLRDDIPYDERSGRGQESEIPADLGRWNWGASGLGFIWGVYHRVWISFLSIIPVFGSIWWIVMGVKGNAWAWRMNRWESVSEYKKSQSGAWKIMGIIFTIIKIPGVCIEIFVISLFVIAFIKNPGDLLNYRETFLPEMESSIKSSIDTSEEEQESVAIENDVDQEERKEEGTTTPEFVVQPSPQQPLPLKKNDKSNLSKNVLKKESIRFEGIDAGALQEVGYGYYTDFHDTWLVDGKKGIRLKGIDKPFVRCFTSILCATDSSIWLLKSRNGEDTAFNEYKIIDVASAKRLAGSQLYTDRKGVWYVDSVNHFIERATEINPSSLRVFADGSADSYDFAIFGDKNAIWTYLEGNEQKLTQITDIDPQSFSRLFPKSDIFYKDKNHVYSFVYGKRDFSGNYIEGDYVLRQISDVDRKTATLIKEPTDPYPRLKDKNGLYVFDQKIFGYYLKKSP